MPHPVETVRRREGQAGGAGVGEDGGIPIRRTQERDGPLPGRDRDAANLEVRRRRAIEELQRRVVPQELLDEGGDARVIPRVDGTRRARREPAVQAVAEAVDGCLVSGVEQQDRRRDELALGQFLAAIAHLHQVGEQIRAGRAHPLARQLADVCREVAARRARRALLLGGALDLIHLDDGLAPWAQEVLVDIGEAEQFGDHQDRQWLGIGGDDIERRAAVGGLVQQLRGELLDARRQPLHVAAPEGAGDQTPQPGVLRRLRVEDGVRVQPVEGLPLGLGPARHEDPAQSPLPQHRAGLLVRGRDEGLQALVPGQGGTGTLGGEGRIRVGEEAGVGEIQEIRGHAGQPLASVGLPATSGFAA